MIVAVIGANGFIGNRIVERFHLGSRHTVIPIVRKPSSLALPARFALGWRIGDALAVPSLAAALRGCDAVIHAAIGDTRQIEAMPAVLGAAAKAAGIRRVVYLSSASVHGQAPEPGTNEDSPLHTRHAFDYNNAKVRAERSFFAACRHHGLDGFAFRPGVVYGPRSRWITDLAADLRRGTAWLLNDGQGICNAISVDNLVDALDLALGAPANSAGPYLVSDAETVTWRELYTAVAAHLGAAAKPFHRIDAVPAFRRTFPDRVKDWAAAPVAQAILPAIPSGLKRLTKRLLTSEPPPANAWRLPDTPSPRVTLELASLQQCAWKFPNDRAARQLGYTPRATTQDALARSLAWLDFAEALR